MKINYKKTNVTFDTRGDNIKLTIEMFHPHKQIVVLNLKDRLALDRLIDDLQFLQEQLNKKSISNG